MDTEITTAARRITRAVNDQPRTLRTYYDEDGSAVETVQADMWHTGTEPEGIPITGRRGAAFRMTEREAQDWLDGHAAAQRGEVERASDHLAAVEADRQATR